MGAGSPGHPAEITFDIPGTAPFLISPAIALPNIAVPVTIDGATEPGVEIDGGGRSIDGLILGPGSNAGNSTIEGLSIVDFGGTGIAIESAGNTIGGTVAGTANTVGSNAGGGIEVLAGTGNVIRQNAYIGANGSLTPVEANDIGLAPDADGGLQPPELAAASLATIGGQQQLSLAFSANVPSSTKVTLDAYLLDSTSTPPQRIFLGTDTETVGNTATIVPAVTLLAGDIIIATATVAGKGTSAFSGEVTTANPYTVTNTSASGPGSLAYVIQFADQHPNPDAVDHTTHITFGILAGPFVIVVVANALPQIMVPVTLDGTTQPRAGGGTLPVVEIDGAIVQPNGTLVNQDLEGLVLAPGFRRQHRQGPRHHRIRPGPLRRCRHPRRVEGRHDPGRLARRGPLRHGGASQRRGHRDHPPVVPGRRHRRRLHGDRQHDRPQPHGRRVDLGGNGLRRHAPGQPHRGELDRLRQLRHQPGQRPRHRDQRLREQHRRRLRIRFGQYHRLQRSGGDLDHGLVQDADLGQRDRHRQLRRQAGQRGRHHPQRCVGNSIGGTISGLSNATKAVGNTIGFNSGAGISITGTSATNNQIVGNSVGVVPGSGSSGSSGAGNGGNGIVLDGGASGNSIGLVTLGLGNVISANHDAGVLIQGMSPDNVLAANIIGTTLGGTVGGLLGNAGDGVLIGDSPANTVGAVPAAPPGPGFSLSGGANIITGNGGDGITIILPASGTIGGANLVQGNLVSANRQNGIHFTGDLTVGTLQVQILDNLVGTTSSGTNAYDPTTGLPQGNGLDGIRLDQSSRADRHGDRFRRGRRAGRRQRGVRQRPERHPHRPGDSVRPL